MSDLPVMLQTRLQDARSWLVLHYRISIWHRQAIYDALGPPAHRAPIDLAAVEVHERQRLEQQQRACGGLPPVRFPKVFGSNRTIGHLRRTCLSILTVDHLMSIWERFASSMEPRKHEAVPKIMAVVRQVYRGEHPAPGALDRLTISLFDVYDHLDMIHYAAGRAYDVAIFDVDFRLYPLLPFQPDKNLSGMRDDVARMAALAMGRDDATFWQWWLDEAVPAAWRAHQDSATSEQGYFKQ
jgi:hypothetical protein